ncbi:MutL C terminal dimerization domain-containing protein, partial [Russula emetica]
GLMEVVGQFNRGFIITRLSKIGGEGLSATDDLFVVDQHAADEKYNFETLQATMRLECQRLFTPRVLELTATEELVALENMTVLPQNGFKVGLEVDQPAGRRLRLLAQPVSKNTEFDVQDLNEILYLLRDHPSGTLMRSSKTRAMFAMRACHKSTMVGAPLNAKQMRTIIRHMGTMEQPWNCPHGRPTMKHLSDVGAVERREEKTVDWATFVS